MHPLRAGLPFGVVVNIIVPGTPMLSVVATFATEQVRAKSIDGRGWGWGVLSAVQLLRLDRWVIIHCLGGVGDGTCQKTGCTAGCSIWLE